VTGIWQSMVGIS